MSDDNDDELNNHINNIYSEWAAHINMHINAIQKAGHIPPNVDLTDFNQEGFRGLMDAFHDWKPTRGAKFTTFAGHKIKGRIMNHATKGGRVDNTIFKEVKAHQDAHDAEVAAAKLNPKDES